MENLLGFGCELSTSRNFRMTITTLAPREEVRAEARGLDRFLRVEGGPGEVEFNGNRMHLSPGRVLAVPTTGRHDLVNTGETPLKLYTLYAPTHLTEAQMWSAPTRRRPPSASR